MQRRAAERLRRSLALILRLVTARPLLRMSVKTWRIMSVREGADENN